MNCTPPPSYLVELMEPGTGMIVDTDLCARLSLAVEKVFLHLSGVSDVQVDVSYDADSQIEGVGFFDSHHRMISCVTVYHLERDDEEPSVPEIDLACRTAGTNLEARLNQIFQKLKV